MSVTFGFLFLAALVGDNPSLACIFNNSQPAMVRAAKDVTAAPRLVACLDHCLSLCVCVCVFVGNDYTL